MNETPYYRNERTWFYYLNCVYVLCPPLTTTRRTSVPLVFKTSRRQARRNGKEFWIGGRKNIVFIQRVLSRVVVSAG
jgi:hypothetical protein